MMKFSVNRLGLFMGASAKGVNSASPTVNEILPGFVLDIIWVSS